jgi:ribonuclease PH
MITRLDGRGSLDLRKVEILPKFHRLAEGSCLYSAGGTVVLCTASVEEKVPPFLEEAGKGWLTAEYQMHPRSGPARRDAREGRGKPLKGRTQEIQRLIGRALRAALDLKCLGPRTITIDCDVLEADGGTRTASITGGFVALALALSHLRSQDKLNQPVLRDQVAAVSVGLVEATTLVDLAYSEDSRAEMDLNLVATKCGDVVEVQGTAEDRPVARSLIDEMIDLGLEGVRQLCEEQAAVLDRSGVKLSELMIRKQ